jgi:hypothetical protein
MNSYTTRHLKNGPVTKRHKDKYQPLLILLSIVLGCFISYGFILAAQNHFAALDLGYKSEEIKRQRDKLELDQRKLTLEMERRLSPQKLDEKAQRQGLSLPVVKNPNNKEEGKKTSD